MWLPIDSIRTTTPAVATAPQAAHLRMMSVLFLSVMRHDLANPRDRRNDSLCSRKGSPRRSRLGRGRCVTKPFGNRELLARIPALLRRSHGQGTGAVLKCRCLRLIRYSRGFKSTTGPSASRELEYVLLKCLAQLQVISSPTINLCGRCEENSITSKPSTCCTCRSATSGGKLSTIRYARKSS